MPETVTIPVQPLLNPLTEEDRGILEKILEDHKAHNDLIDRCAECGLDMQERKQRTLMHRDVASKLLEKFFPTQLSPPNG